MNNIDQMIAALPAIEAVPEEQNLCWPDSAHGCRAREEDHAASAAAVDATVGLQWEWHSWRSTAVFFREEIAAAGGACGAGRCLAEMPDIYTLAYAIWDNDAKQASMSPVIDAYYDWPAVPVDHRIAVTSRITMRVLREVIAWLPGGDFERLSSVASLQQAVKILENLVMVSIDIPLSVDVGSEQETLDVGRFVLEARQNALYAAQSALRDACVPLYAAHAAAYAASAAYCVAHNRAKAALECLPSLSQHSAGAERAAEKFASAEASEIMKKAAKIWVEERYYSTTYCAQVVR